MEDTELKRLIGIMLKGKVCWRQFVSNETNKIITLLQWGKEWDHEDGESIRDTELLELCRMVEKNLTERQRKEYCWKLQQGFLPETPTAQELQVFATWQEKTIALAKIKGLIK